MFVARLHLGHLVAESRDRGERFANRDAAHKLIHATESFKRAFGDLLDEIRQIFGLSAENDTRQIRDRVLNFLVEKNLVKVIANENIVFALE